MNELKSLQDAHAILADLFSRTWADSTLVSTRLPLTLLHAREHVEQQIAQSLTGGLAEAVSE